MEVEFEWDEHKNALNQKKHGISFEEAKSCFEDEHARIFFDVEHSKNEDRSILIGLSALARQRKKNSNTIGMNEKETDYEKGV